MAKKLVSGIFYSLDAAEGTFAEKSRKWQILVVLAIIFALIVFSGLIYLASFSHSGIGLPVVGATFGAGILIYIFRRMDSFFLKIERITAKNLTFFYLGLSGLFLLLVGVVAFLVLPVEGSTLPLALIIGSLMITAYLFLIFEVYPILQDRGAPGLITMAGLIIVFAIVYMTAISKYIVPYDPFTLNVGPTTSPPTSEFIFGTTELGQDMLSRVIAGGANMLQVAVLSVTVCFSIGVPIGLIASYYGGIIDRGTSLVMDSIFALPGLILAIALAAMLGPGIVNMAMAIAVIYIPSYFRVVRSQVLTVKELPYVEAAIVLGARNRDILIRYILPNVLPSAVVVMTINFADAVLTAAGLTFVGLGFGIDVPDWGYDLSSGRPILLQVGAWWVITFPGLMIVLLAIGFTLTGEGLNELLTPKLQE
ncbi:MAG: ABC transporter permease [Candidatus Thorarchaeota archaeon]|nr:ABC transporter permease [Candidatus Thorarchaeota archaeon]